MALPRGAHEVGRFNGLRQGLGEWCLIAVQPVSEATPKPLGPRPRLTVPINIYGRQSAEVTGSDSFGRADGTNHSVQNCVPDSTPLSEEYPRNRATLRCLRHERHGGPKLAARDTTDLTEVPPLPARGATS
jgi:hypothetical protein